MTPPTNTTPDIDTHDSSKCPPDSNGMETTNPPCEQEQSDVDDTSKTNKTEKDESGSEECATGDVHSSTTKSCNNTTSAGVSPELLSLTSPTIPGPVPGSAVPTTNERDRKLSPPTSSLTSSSEVLPGAVAIGGMNTDIDCTSIVDEDEGGMNNTNRDSRNEKRQEMNKSRTRDDSHRTEDGGDDKQQSVPLSGALTTTERSFMNAHANPSESIFEQVDGSETENYFEDVGKIDSGKDEEDIIAIVTSTKPATIASIPPVDCGDSFRYGDDSTTFPTVQAELVPPPIEAYRVSIDEEQAGHALVLNGLSPFELGQQESENMGNTKPRWYNLREKRFSLRCSILIALLTVVAIFATAIPLASVGGRDYPDPQSETEQPPTSAPTFPYRCYTSTYDIIVDQILEDPLPDVFVICPDTVIQVGTFADPAVHDFQFVDGDYPIIAVKPNVVIQCGIDGKRENNCTLDGGFMQVLTLNDAPVSVNSEVYIVNASIDNFTVRGLTFTGQPINSGPFQGMSVTLSHPGHNIRFEDCLWRDLSAQNGLIGVYQNSYQDFFNIPLPDDSIDVTFSDCEFENIVYDSPLIFAMQQTVVLERTVFNSISLSILVANGCRFETDGYLLQYDGGCAGLLYCGAGSVCSMTDICVLDFEYQGPSIVNVAENAVFTWNDLFLSPMTSQNITDGESDDDDGDDTMGNSTLFGNGNMGTTHNVGGSVVLSGTLWNETCSLTFIALVDSTVSNCTDIFTAPTCPLDLL
jgi:hypothetical protein